LQPPESQALTITLPGHMYQSYTQSNSQFSHNTRTLCRQKRDIETFTGPTADGKLN